MCFDSKVVNDPKRLSFQLTSSGVNMFCLRQTFAIIIRFKYCRTCIFVIQMIELESQKIKPTKSKIKICLFHRNQQDNITLTANGIQLHSKQYMNVLSVIFDLRPQWNEHIAHIIKKTNTVLHCVKQIKCYYNLSILPILNQNFYSVLYYNYKIWSIPSLYVDAKQKLLLASVALKICTPSY